MLRSRQLFLIAAAVVLLGPAASAHARPPACHAIAVRSADQILLLRNPADRPMSFELRFESGSNAPRSCGLLTLDAGTDTGKQTLASLCPAASTAAAGVLKACRAPLTVQTHRGVATGDLLGDLQANNLPVAAQ